MTQKINAGAQASQGTGLLLCGPCPQALWAWLQSARQKESSGRRAAQHTYKNCTGAQKAHFVELLLPFAEFCSVCVAIETGARSDL